MEFLLQRTEKHKDYTIGCLFAGNELICNTLEPTWRDIGWGHKGRKVDTRGGKSPAGQPSPRGATPWSLPTARSSRHGSPCFSMSLASRGYASMRGTRSRIPKVASSSART